MKNKKDKSESEIKFPHYIGEVEIFKKFVIKLEKMPSKKHQENMKREFGWIFREEDLKNDN